MNIRIIGNGTSRNVMKLESECHMLLSSNFLNLLRGLHCKHVNKRIIVFIISVVSKKKL